MIERVGERDREESTINRVQSSDRVKSQIHHFGSKMVRNALADRSNLSGVSIDVCCKQTTVGDSQQKQKHHAGQQNRRVGRERDWARAHNAPAPASRSHRRCRALSWQDLLLLFQSSRTPPSTDKTNPHTFLGARMSLSERRRIEHATLEGSGCFASSAMTMSHHAQVFEYQCVDRCPTDAYQGRQRLVTSSQSQTMKRSQHNFYLDVRDDREDLRYKSCDLRAWLLANSRENEPIDDVSLGEGK